MRALAPLLVFALAAPAAANEVWIDYPTGEEFVHGLVEVVVVVTGEEPVAAVDFFLDGTKVARLVQAPYRITVDVGIENVEHSFRVVALSPGGTSAESTVRTPMLTVDEAIELRLQQLYVTVSRNDQRVLGLERGDFRVTEAGERQKIVTFERGEVPFTAALLLDCSLSMKGERIVAALEGAALFLRGMEALDESKLLLFSDRLLRETPFAGDGEELVAFLEGVRASGGTAINDHLFLALKRLEQRQGRRVVVLFSDGADVHSVLSMREVVEKVRKSQALIYWIYLRDPADGEDVPEYSSSWRDIEANREEFKLLRQAVAESGGRIQVVDRLEELEGAFAEILAELREQYVLGYYPSDPRRDGSWREVKVRVERPGVQVRSRGGYLAH